MWQSVTSLSRSIRMHGARLGATTRRQQPILRTRWDELVNNQTTGSSHGESSDMNKLEDINSEHISLRRIKSYIRNLEIPAEAKVILDKLLNATVNVGGQLYRIGRKVVEIAIILATKFPAITFALILTSFINFLIAAIPLLGPVLAPIVGPLVTATGVVIGAYKDITEPELRKRMEELVGSIKKLFSAASVPNPA